MGPRLSRRCKEDADFEFIALRLEEKLTEWEALNVLPTEPIDELSNYDRGHRMYGMYRWRDMFSPRQLFAHCTSVAVLTELLESYTPSNHLMRRPRLRSSILVLS